MQKEILATTSMYTIPSNFQSNIPALTLHMTFKQQSRGRYSDQYLKGEKTAFSRRVSDLPRVTKIGREVEAELKSAFWMLTMFLPFSTTLDLPLFYSANPQAFRGPRMLFCSILSCTGTHSHFSPSLGRSSVATTTLGNFSLACFFLSPNLSSILVMMCLTVFILFKFLR